MSEAELEDLRDKFPNVEIVAVNNNSPLPASALAHVIQMPIAIEVPFPVAPIESAEDK